MMASSPPNDSRQSMESEMDKKGDRSRVPSQTKRVEKSSPYESTTVGSGHVPASSWRSRRT